MERSIKRASSFQFHCTVVNINMASETESVVSDDSNVDNKSSLPAIVDGKFFTVYTRNGTIAVKRETVYPRNIDISINYLPVSSTNCYITPQRHNKDFNFYPFQTLR